MSSPTISHLAKHYDLGDAFSNRKGIRCYPAVDRENGNRYIAKVHSYPAKSAATEAFLISGAFQNVEKINTYYREQARDLCKQAAILNSLSHFEHFSHFTFCQTEPKDDLGYDVWLLSPYRKTLAVLFDKIKLSREEIIELGLQLCQALTQCRQTGYLYIGMKPENIFISPKGQFQIGDVGFVALSSLPYATLPERYHSAYTPPENQEFLSVISESSDVYGVGAILYQAISGGKRPDDLKKAPMNADSKLSSIIMKACASSSNVRWKDPTELEHALRECIGGNRMDTKK